MYSPSQNTALHRLQNVEKRIVRVLELAGGVMDEFSNPSGPRKELVNNHCREFMQLNQGLEHKFRRDSSNCSSISPCTSLGLYKYEVSGSKRYSYQWEEMAPDPRCLFRRVRNLPKSESDVVRQGGRCWGSPDNILYLFVA